MPYLAGRGQANIGRGFFASGKIPDAPVFPFGSNSSASGDGQLSVSFDPGFNGRSCYNELSI